MKRMKLKSLLWVAMAVYAAGSTTGAGIIGEAAEITLSPVLLPTASSVASTASTMLANEKRQAYLAAAGMAAHFVQTEGGVPVPPILREVMETEKTIVAQARGPKAAALLNDLHLAQMVVWRAEEFKRKE